MKPMISIIVPIYNVELYIHRCIKSLLEQTYEQIEIILVNDGSSDNCPMICEQYGESDPRVKVIHKVNGGLSDARNVGLKEARGEYVLFVDSDDYIDINTCKNFITYLEDRPDIVVGNARVIKDDKISYMRHRTVLLSKKMTGIEYLKKELREKTMYMAAWLNLYKKTFLVENNLYFRVGLLHEDEEFTPRVFLKANTVIGTEIIFYNYLIRQGSITTTVNKTKNAKDMFLICENLDAIYSELVDIELRNLLYDNLVDKYLHIFQIAKLHKKQNNHLIDKSFLKGKALTKRNKRRVKLFFFSPSLYYYINKCSKLFKNN